MEGRLILFLSLWMAVDSNKLHYECTTAIWKDVVKLERDAPSVRVVLGQTAILSCCYSPLIPECNKTSTTTPTSNPCPSVQWTWIRRETHNSSSCGNMTNDNRFTMWVEWLGPRQICGKLTIRQSHYNDSQLYRCKLEDNNSIIFSHGTYLRVYVPIPRLLSLNEDTKNSLLKAQGILLMLCVLLPGAALLCKAKVLNEQSIDLKKRREEENIYEGLNLDECSMYHDISRSGVRGPYEDVGNLRDCDIQLEKP
ncbi:B-cell antigen receptor complex-associated protein alpha chain [Amia ocellicauda]|uniref:B-cell antigen receptor complex-associated protein alpha chain n=1 Tax=Amia ocellicauda TaxID=2972642 RepID=UPI0034640416